MIAAPARGALWAQPEDVREQTLPLWRAMIIALGLEIIIPFLVFGVDWSFLPSFDEPPPTEVMSVRLEQPPAQLLPPPEQERKREQKPREPKKLQAKQVAVEPPKPLPNEQPTDIALPKPEPEPKPEPKVEEELQPPELPPLPSVFRDVKPVKKVKPKYPREAEDKKIEGRVRVRLQVELDGTVSNVELLVSEPAGVFEDAVFEAVRQYLFKKDGTRYFADQEVIFKIDP